MKKHWWIALVLVFALAIPVAASQAIKIYVNGAELKSDVAAQVINGRTMVPIRAIAEYFGKTVDYNETTKTVSITGKTTLEIASAISTEWVGSKHANTKEPLSYAGVRGAGCAPCHSGNSLERYGTDNPYKSEGIVSNSANDKVNTYKFDPHAADLPTPIGCATCHSGNGAEILKSGVIPSSINSITKGTDWNVGSKDALCFTCHNARRDVKSIYLGWATPGAAKQSVYPHHGWDALVTGVGGMEYPGVKYAQSSTHKSIGCVGCHMSKTEDGYASHKFEPDMATCTKCHVGQTEFTMGGGLEKELEEKLATLEKLVLAKIPGAVKIGTDHSTSPAVNKDNVKIEAKDIASVEALVGAYNYAIIKQELEHGGKGVHNPQYAKALLNESIKRLQ